MSRRRQFDRSLAAEFGPEDGRDPRAFHRKPWDPPRRAGRKARQLCGQVTEALHGALAACGDRVLQGLAVVGVGPAPHTGRLRVLVALPADGSVTAVSAAAHLERAAGVLRAAVAASITRRYAPELTFEVTAG